MLFRSIGIRRVDVHAASDGDSAILFAMEDTGVVEAEIGDGGLAAVSLQDEPRAAIKREGVAAEGRVGTRGRWLLNEPPRYTL